MNTRLQALIVVPLIISIITGAFGLAGYLAEKAFGISISLGMPAMLRGVGVLVLILGFLLLVWLFKYRKPFEILTSTYATMRKAIGRTQSGDASFRTGPLVLQGPQRYVRHPMYFAVVLMFIGWWLALDYTFLLFMAFFFFLLFNLVVIPYEEKELRALYGDEYNAYARTVPRFFPSLKDRWR